MGGLRKILPILRVCAVAATLLVLNAGDARAGAVFETGQRTLSTTVDRGGWVRVNLTKPFVNPVVVTGPLTHRNDAPLSVRVRNVSPGGFDIGMQSPCESAGEAGRGVQCPPSGGYTSEDVVYWVVEAGAWVFPDGREIEAGLHRTATVRSNLGGGTNNASDAISFLRQSFSATPGLYHTVNSAITPHRKRSSRYPRVE